MRSKRRSGTVSKRRSGTGAKEEDSGNLNWKPRIPKFRI